jgi:hypothetical protein
MGRHFVVGILLLGGAAFVLTPALPNEIPEHGTGAIMRVEFASADTHIIAAATIPALNTALGEVQFFFKPLRQCTEGGNDFCSPEFGEARTAFFSRTSRTDQ